MKEGGGAEGECERERALGVLLCHSPGLGPVRNSVLLNRVRLFSLVPLVWESNPVVFKAAEKRT